MVGVTGGERGDDLGGDTGSSVSRRPIAWSIALAIAAIGGAMFTSPTPFAP
jgi:hypothetical protein